MVSLLQILEVYKVERWSAIKPNQSIFVFEWLIVNEDLFCNFLCFNLSMVHQELSTTYLRAAWE